MEARKKKGGIEITNLPFPLKKKRRGGERGGEGGFKDKHPTWGSSARKRKKEGGEKDAFNFSLISISLSKKKKKGKDDAKGVLPLNGKGRERDDKNIFFYLGREPPRKGKSTNKAMKENEVFGRENSSSREIGKKKEGWSSGKGEGKISPQPIWERGKWGARTEKPLRARFKSHIQFGTNSGKGEKDPYRTKRKRGRGIASKYTIPDIRRGKKKKKKPSFILRKRVL